MFREEVFIKAITIVEALQMLTEKRKIIRDQGCCHVDYHTHSSEDIVDYLINQNPQLTQFEILQTLSRESLKSKKDRVIFKSKIGDLYFIKKGS